VNAAGSWKGLLAVSYEQNYEPLGPIKYGEHSGNYQLLVKDRAISRSAIHLNAIEDTMFMTLFPVMRTTSLSTASRACYNPTGTRN
jgi:hypothetical protein